MFRTVNDQPTLWDSILPAELSVLPVELGQVDELLDDPVFFAPFAAYFDARIGRPSTPRDLSAVDVPEVATGWAMSRCTGRCFDLRQRFCRIPFGTRVPHATTCEDHHPLGMTRSPV